MSFIPNINILYDFKKKNLKSSFELCLMLTKTIIKTLKDVMEAQFGLDKHLHAHLHFMAVSMNK